MQNNKCMPRLSISNEFKVGYIIYIYAPFLRVKSKGKGHEHTYAERCLNFLGHLVVAKGAMVGNDLKI